jgi:hypothetical protein
VNRLRKYRDWWDTPAKQLVLVLLLFLVVHKLVFLNFYSGFTGFYDKLFLFFEKKGASLDFLLHKPYHDWSITLSALMHPLFLLGSLLVGFFLFNQWKKLSWELFENAKWIKWFLVVVAFILTWELVTYDYNYYLDRGHYFDRFLLIALAALILRHPGFVPVFIVVALLFRSQFNYPVDGFSLWDKRVLYDLLILFSVYMIMKLAFKKTAWKFLWLSMCVVGANYFITGVAKIGISPHGYEWLAYDQLNEMFVNAGARGWGMSLSPETFDSVAQALKTFNFPLKLIIFLLEAAGIVLLFRKRLSMILLVGWFLMHVGIFLVGGMFFWKWMVVDMVLFVLLWKMPVSVTEELFDRSKRLPAFIAIVTSFIWLSPLPIAWHNTSFTQLYSYEAVDEKGEVYLVQKNMLNPYHQWFQYDDFSFLLKEPVLPVTGFGYTRKYQLAKETRSTPYLKLVENYGVHKYDADKALAFDSFVQDYFKSRNKRLNGQAWWTILAPPHHLHNALADRNHYSGKEKIVKFRVRYYRYHHKDGNMIQDVNHIVREIEIPD